MRKVADYEMMGKRLKEARRKAKMTQVQLALRVTATLNTSVLLKMAQNIRHSICC